MTNCEYIMNFDSVIPLFSTSLGETSVKIGHLYNKSLNIPGYVLCIVAEFQLRDSAFLLPAVPSWRPECHFLVALTLAQV